MTRTYTYYARTHDLLAIGRKRLRNRFMKTFRLLLTRPGGEKRVRTDFPNWAFWTIIILFLPPHFSSVGFNGHFLIWACASYTLKGALTSFTGFPDHLFVIFFAKFENVTDRVTPAALRDLSGYTWTGMPCGRDYHLGCKSVRGWSRAHG